MTIRNSNLRSPGFGIRDSGFEEHLSSNPQSQIPNPNTRQFHAHCVCVVGKTTVCRIFSCQRSLRGKYRPAESFGDRGALSPGPPSLAHSWGPNAPLRSLASITRAPPRTPARSLAGTPSPRSASSQLAHLRSLATSQHSFVAEPKSLKDCRIREPGAGVSGASAKGASASGRHQLTKWRIPGSNR